MLATSIRIPLADPEAVLNPLCAHFVEHEAIVITEGGETVIRLDAAEARLVLSAAALDVTVKAPDAVALQAMKRAIASHVVEFAPQGAVPRFLWNGDGVGPVLPADFRILTVTSIETITPCMRRIRFRGENLARFDRLDALHVRLFIPPVGLAEPAWPMIGEDGLLVLPPLEARPSIRKYTIREIDEVAGTLAFDFVLHDDAGPGSAFASRAKAGDRIGMAGPGGRGLQTAKRYVFLADETGLPAVARMLAALPAEAVGQVFLEVADDREEQVLRAPAGIIITWLHRDSAAAGSPPLLQKAFAKLDWPADGPDAFLWAAMEHGAFREIRAAARGKLRPGRDQHLIVSYWRRGAAEEEHAAAKKAEASKG